MLVLFKNIFFVFNTYGEKFMKKIIFTVIVCFCFFFSYEKIAKAFLMPSEQHPAALKLQTCLMQNNATQAALTSCFTQAQKDWDEDLNSIYKQIMENIKNPSLKDAIRSTQREWIVYRDKEIALIQSLFSLGQGPMWDIRTEQFKSEIVQHRVAELYGIYNMGVEIGIFPKGTEKFYNFEYMPK